MNKWIRMFMWAGIITCAGFGVLTFFQILIHGKVTYYEDWPIVLWTEFYLALCIFFLTIIGFAEAIMTQLRQEYPEYFNPHCNVCSRTCPYCKPPTKDELQEDFDSGADSGERVDLEIPT